MWPAVMPGWPAPIGHPAIGPIIIWVPPRLSCGDPACANAAPSTKKAPAAAVKTRLARCICFMVIAPRELARQCHPLAPQRLDVDQL
jgi:hypothetical protein